MTKYKSTSFYLYPAIIFSLFFLDSHLFRRDN